MRSKYDMRVLVAVSVFLAVLFISGLPTAAQAQDAAEDALITLDADSISVNAVLLGLFPATVLPMIWLERLPLPHASEPYNPVFWGVLTLGAFAGALTAYLAHVWMVYCGLVPWRALAVGGGKPAPLKRIPKLRTLGAIVLTYAVLIGVIVALLPLMD